MCGWIKSAMNTIYHHWLEATAFSKWVLMSVNIYVFLLMSLQGVSTCTCTCMSISLGLILVGNLHLLEIFQLLFLYMYVCKFLCQARPLAWIDMLVNFFYGMALFVSHKILNTLAIPNSWWKWFWSTSKWLVCSGCISTSRWSWLCARCAMSYNIFHQTNGSCCQLHSVHLELVK